MIRKAFATMTGVALLLASSATQTVIAKAGGSMRSAQEVRTEVMRLGAGEKARVKVRLRDGTKLKGYVSRAGEQSFAVTDGKAGVTREVAYADVAQVRKYGGGMSGTTKALIWGGVAATAAAVLFAARGAFCDGCD